jgi:pyruvate kinase
MGPATENVQTVENLLRGGMNVARFNFSHSDHEYHKKNMERVREASINTKIPVALMLDTRGPEIRTGGVADDGKIQIVKGERVLVSTDGIMSQAANGADPARLSVTWGPLPQEVVPGVRILIADGLIELNVIETDGAVITTEAMNSGALGSRKNVNIIGIHPNLPIMTEKDKEDIAFGVKMDIDFIAASFTSSASDILEIRKYLASFDSKIRIIAKIESQEGLDNIHEITEAADGVMVARGDLGVQLPVERIPLAQKQIIACCRSLGKPVITATQLLDSMIVNPRPTRAELTDVANAIFDGTDAVMLSGETANGAYPVEAVETMARISATVEQSDEYRSRMRALQQNSLVEGSIAETVTRVAYITASDINAAAILIPTMSGNTARMVSMYRPEQPIAAATPYEQVQRQLLLNWGVEPILSKLAHNSDDMIQHAMKSAIDAGAIRISDRVIMVAGIPVMSPVMVNTIRVILVGNILGRGLHGGGCIIRDDGNTDRATGRIISAESPNDATHNLKKRGGEILVCPSLNMDYAPILRVVDGLVVENDIEIPEDVLTMINPDLIWISRVRDAMKILENGLTVTIDGKELVVYEGSV